MSPITDDDHVDELKERRRARQSRPELKRPAPARIPSAEPARDLLGGLITSASPEGNEDRSAGAQNATDVAPGPAREATSVSDSCEDRTEATDRVGAEKIDELIRRVKEGTPADADAATTIQRRRPKGTVDLSPAAAPRRGHRHTRPTTPLRSSAPRTRRTRFLGIAATLLVVGSADLLITLSGGSDRLSPTRSDTSSTSTAGSFGAFGVVNGAIAALGPELQPFAQRAARAARTSRTRAHRRRTPSHVKPARHTPRASRRPTRAASALSPSTATTVQTQTYAPASPPAPTTSQTPVSATHSTTSSTRPSGPSGSNPLGGIGACVKGC